MSDLLKIFFCFLGVLYCGFLGVIAGAFDSPIVVIIFALCTAFCWTGMWTAIETRKEKKKNASSREKDSH